jgi:hypothetical protein
MENKKELLGTAMSAGAAQALLEIINGGPEIGRLSPEEKKRFGIAIPKSKVGRIMVFSTASDMDKDNSRLLWEKE